MKKRLVRWVWVCLALTLVEACGRAPVPPAQPTLAAPVPSAAAATAPALATATMDKSTPAAGSASADKTMFQANQFKVRVTYDLVYGAGAVRAPTPGSKELKLDLYEPEGDAAPSLRPGVIMIHGGSFVEGDKNSPGAIVVSACRDLAARGYACVSINYRLAGDDPPTTGNSSINRAILAAVEDAATAVRWLADNAARYRIDPGRIALGGASAGAIASLLLAYPSAGQGLPIRAVIDLWGAMYDQVNTIQKGKPPLIIVHGTLDPTVSYTYAQAIVNRAREVGLDYEAYPVEGAGHSVPLETLVNGVSLHQRIADFLYTRLDLARLAAAQPSR